MSYKFERILSTDEHIKILYELLKMRNYVISHRSLPNFENHSYFVKNHPYLHWFLVSDDINCFGSFYLTKSNSIGLNLTEYNKEIMVACVNFIRDNFKPQAAQPSIIPEYFYINLSCSNTEAVTVLQQLDRYLI